MYLAQHLGYASPTKMVDEMRPEDWVLWRAYYELFPFGEIREDARHGIRAALFASAHTKKGGKQPKPQDFIPKIGSEDRKKRVMNTQEMLAWAEAMRAAGAVVVRAS